MYKIFTAISKNTVITVVLIAMICLAAYLNYIYKPGNVKPSASDKVSGTAKSTQTYDKKVKSKANDNTKNKAVSDAVVDNSGDYFAKCKLDRESTRAKQMEWNKSIMDDKTARQIDRDAARANYFQLVNFAGKENEIEKVLLAKGIRNVVTLGWNNAKDVSASVIVDGKISNQRRAQIEDAVINTVNLSDFSKIKIISLAE